MQKSGGAVEQAEIADGQDIRCVMMPVKACRVNGVVMLILAIPRLSDTNVLKGLDGEVLFALRIIYAGGDLAVGILTCRSLNFKNQVVNVSCRDVRTLGNGKESKKENK